MITGDVKSQGINCHGIDQVLSIYTGIDYIDAL